MRCLVSARVSGAALAAISCATSNTKTLPEPAFTSLNPKPAGVVVDPLPAPLQPTTVASTSEHAIIALTAPLPWHEAVRVLEAFVAAVLREEEPTLRALLEPEATWYNSATGPAGATRALPLWRERFRRFDYTSLSVVTLYAVNEVKIDTSDPQRSVHPATSLPLMPASDDRWVRITILASRVGPDRLWGDRLSLRLHPAGSTFRIRAIEEENFSMP